MASSLLKHPSSMRSRFFALFATFMLPVQGWISSPFGVRSDPYTGRAAFHAGVDISSKYASAVKVVADGVVSFAGKKGGYGRLVIIAHGSSLQTYYGHLGRIFVREGETVVAGQAVGWTGMTGRSTGPHVHYEVRWQDGPLNPLYSETVSMLRGSVPMASGASGLEEFWVLLFKSLEQSQASQSVL